MAWNTRPDPRVESGVSDLIRWETDLEPAAVRATTMIVALEGFIDAGRAQALAVEHLLTTSESRVLASFDLDALLDYRARRPRMIFDRDHWASASTASLAIHRLTDATGQPYLLLTGPEPDYRWEAFIEVALRAARVLGVRTIASMHGVPVGVPHTRPVTISRYASSRVLLDPESTSVFGRVEVPGSAQSLLQFRAGEAGFDVLGFAVHVPPYLMETRFTPAVAAGLRAMSAVTGLDLRIGRLDGEAESDLATIDRQVAADPEAAEVVAEMERRYDEIIANGDALVGTLPNADEIGAEFESFLRAQKRGEAQA